MTGGARRTAGARVGSDFLRFALLAAALMCAAPAARAAAPTTAEFPADVPADFVHDGAALLDDAARAAVAAVNARLAGVAGPLVVVTTERFAGADGSRDEARSLALQLFDRWDFDRKSAGRGILLLVARDERHGLIELGRGFGGSRDFTVRSVTERALLPALARGEFARGVRESAWDLCLYAVTGRWPYDPTLFPGWLEGLLIIGSFVWYLVFLIRLELAGNAPDPKSSSLFLKITHPFRAAFAVLRAAFFAMIHYGIALMFYVLVTFPLRSLLNAFHLLPFWARALISVPSGALASLAILSVFRRVHARKGLKTPRTGSPKGEAR